MHISCIHCDFFQTCSLCVFIKPIVSFSRLLSFQVDFFFLISIYDMWFLLLCAWLISLNILLSSFFLHFHTLFYVCEYFVCIYIYSCSTHRGQNRVLDFLGLDLWIVVSYHVGPRSSARAQALLMAEPFLHPPEFLKYNFTKQKNCGHFFYILGNQYEK